MIEMNEIKANAIGWWFGLNTEKKAELAMKYFPTKKCVAITKDNKLIQTIYERENL
jgi:hypothetical protein